MADLVSREDKVAQLMIQLDDNANLRTLLRMVFKDALAKIDDVNLFNIYYTLNPPFPEEDPPPDEPPPEDPPS